MNFVLVVVIVTGLVLGYWLVSALLSPPPARHGAEIDPADDPAGDPADAASEPPARSDLDETPLPHRHWTVVLGTRAEADVSTLSAAYRRALAQYAAADDDTLAPELRALARKRRAEIEAAYLEAMRARR